MYRRRRIKRDIPFSFDSFLDLVANVCGIIIRLILVAWVGARSYHAVSAHQHEDSILTGSQIASLELPPISDPMEGTLREHRQTLAQQESRLVEQIRKLHDLRARNSESVWKLGDLAAAQAAAAKQRESSEQTATKVSSQVALTTIALTDLEKRTAQLLAEFRDLENSSPSTKTLRYRTPVSRPVHTDELHFECKDGRICFIDVQAFVAEIKRDLQDKGNLLKTRWEAESVTSPVGPFRLRYTIERERGLLDSAGIPNPDANFRFGLSAWTVEALTPARGEALKVALASGSAFRRLADALDPEQTVVTLWVYQDSFALYREIRDFLYERGFEVAGRALPEGVPIASSRLGSASRGQQ